MYLKPSIQNINSIKNLKKIDSTAILVLQNGKFFKGVGLGYKGTATGEVCFNTGMTGYQEVFTDPSYYGQLMITTNASKFVKRILDKLQHFKKVELTVSVDGQGAVYDYIRYPYTWDQWKGRMNELFEFAETTGMKKDKKLISIIEDSQQYRQEKDIVTIDYIPKIEEKEGQEPKRIVPKNDNKQKSLFEF